MPDSMVQVILRTADNIPANFVTNQFCIAGLGPSTGNVSGVQQAIIGFYNQIRAAVFSSDLEQDAHMMKFYDLAGATPNYPWNEQTFNFSSAPSGSGLPSEVALVMSFQGVRIAGQVQARRRGRIYLGPLNSGIYDSGRPRLTNRQTVATAATAFGAAINAVDPTYEWAVWSPTNGSAVPVVDGWLDDAFDTQRSRGKARTSRNTFSV